VIPGLVGMHDHLLNPDGGGGYPVLYSELGFSAPLLGQTAASQFLLSAMGGQLSFFGLLGIPII
jgi:hypothetical protein